MQHEQMLRLMEQMVAHEQGRAVATSGLSEADRAALAEWQVDYARRVVEVREQAVVAPPREAFPDIGLRWWRGRWIAQAYDPVPPSLRNEIEGFLPEGVPDGLAELWSVAFGGRIYYQLPPLLGDRPWQLFDEEAGASGSYLDWLADDLAALQDEDPDVDCLEWLPFATVDDRAFLYCGLRGAEEGAVSLALPNGEFVRVADDVCGLFERFGLVPEDAPKRYSLAREFEGLYRRGPHGDEIWAAYLGCQGMRHQSS